MFIQIFEYPHHIGNNLIGVVSEKQSLFKAPRKILCDLLFYYELKIRKNTYRHRSQSLGRNSPHNISLGSNLKEVTMASNNCKSGVNSAGGSWSKAVVVSVM
jgi:hypothetical protein